MLVEFALVALEFLVICPNGARDIWDKRPHPNQVPVGSQIVPWEPQPGRPDPNDYVRGPGDRCALKPVAAAPAPSSEEVAARELHAALTKYAGDSNCEDALYMRLYRCDRITDPVAKMQQWEQLKQLLPK